jgi:hypothetical protein
VAVVVAAALAPAAVSIVIFLAVVDIVVVVQLVKSGIEDRVEILSFLLSSMRRCLV